MEKITIWVLGILFCAFLSISNGQENKVMVCYWGTWSHYRTDEGHFSIEQIPEDLCTHLVYTFFVLNETTFEVKSNDPYLDFAASDPEGGGPGSNDMIRKTISLREKNPKLKVTIAVGGWNAGSALFSKMAANPAYRSAFIQSAINLITKFDFDGIDMDWEYPARREGSHPEDKDNFTTLLKELREALDKVSRPGKDPLLLTSAFGCYEKYLDVSYDIPQISKYLDYLHLMLYDFKMYLTDDEEPGGTLIGHHSPLYSKPEEQGDGNYSLTDSFSVDSFLDRGAPPEKLVFGVGAYGKTYALFNRSMHNFYDEAKAIGPASKWTQQDGLTAQFEICLELQEPGQKWEVSIDDDYKVPYAFSDTKWIGYDNEISAKIKTDYAMSKGLAGMMVWSLDFDDFNNYCKGWFNFPIVNSMKDRLIYHENKNKTLNPAVSIN